MVINPHKNPIIWRLYMKHFACTFIMFLTVLAMCNIILAETDAEYDKALKYYNSGKYKEAVELFKHYVQTKPEPSAYYRIGYALYKLRKYGEADEYFKMAYLIDPMFSPQQHGLPELPENLLKEPAEPMHEQAPSQQIPPDSKEMQPEAKQAPLPEKQLSKESQSQKAQEPIVTSTEEPSLPEPQMVEPPQGSFQPPAGFQPFSRSGKDMQGPPPGVPMGLLAGLGIMIYLIAFAVYIFTSLCLFLIAKRLNVPAPWTAWIPVIQVWTFVSSAGKAWWWILLLLVPIVNTIVGVYLWICITENLGRNKWLGLLMLLPLINLVFLGILAFSKTEQPSYTGVGTTTA
jgi:hypothetical protein